MTYLGEKMNKTEDSWIMPLVRIMWLDLSDEEKEEVSMVIQKCLDDKIIDSCLDKMIDKEEKKKKEIGLNKCGRTNGN